MITTPSLFFLTFVLFTCDLFFVFLHHPVWLSSIDFLIEFNCLKAPLPVISIRRIPFKVNKLLLLSCVCDKTQNEDLYNAHAQW